MAGTPHPPWRMEGLCRWRQQRVRAESKDRRQVVELQHRRRGEVLARGGEWGGVYRLGDGKVYAFGLSEVGRKQARVAFKRPRPEAASPWLQPQVVRAGRNTVRRELGGVEE